MSDGRHGRREKLRSEMLAAIHDAAWRQVRQAGAAQLSLRAVANEVGLSSAGVYRYYASRDDLLTALLSEGFAALAEALRTAAEPAPSPPDALVAMACAYRRWAVAHPQDFALIFGSPVPDYRAPEEGPTTQAARRVGTLFVTVFTDVWRGHVPAEDQPSGPAARPATGYPLAGDLLVRLVAGWGQVHGLVALEVFGHLGWVDGDPEQILVTAVRRLLPPG